MRLIKGAIAKPITTFMIFFFFIILGVISFLLLPIDLMPKIEAPVVSIITAWPGATAEDIEKNVTKHIENEVGIVSDLDEVRSISREGLSIVHCLFNMNADPNIAANEIKDKLELVKYRFVDDVKKPMVFKFDTSMLPIVMFGIKAKNSYKNLYNIAEDDIAAAIRRVKGVGSAQIFGGMQKQINVKLDRKKLAKHSITPDHVDHILRLNNLNLPSGNIILGDMEYIIRVPGEFKSSDEIRNTLIKKDLYLRDIAEVEDGYKEVLGTARIQKDDSLILFIQKKSGVNTPKVAAAVRKRVKELKQKLPKDVEIMTIMDSSEFIKLAVNNLLKTIALAAIFVAATTFFFLSNIRSSLIIIFAIPFSVITAFAFIYFMGWSINTMSLAAIAIAIGMVVDNAVVVVDSITNRIGSEPLKESAYKGARGVSKAITASTLTTIVIFLPLVFVTGIVGVMFKQMGGVVTVTLAASLLSALIFTPMISSKLLKKRTKEGIFEPFFKSLEKKYKDFLLFALNNRKRMLIYIFSSIIFIFFLTPFIGSEFIPEEDTGDLTITFELPLGTPLKKTIETCKKLEKISLDITNRDIIKNFYWRAGVTENSFGSAMGRKEGANIGIFGMKLVKRKKRSEFTKEVARKIADRIKNLPEIVSLSVDAGNPMSKIVFSGKKPITIDILGHNLEETKKLAESIQELAKNIPGTKDIKVSRDFSRPELIIKPNRVKAANLGIDISNLSRTLRALFCGRDVITFHPKEKNINVLMKLQPDQRGSLEDILATQIKSNNGREVPLYNFVEVEERKGPLEIERKNQERLITVDIDTFKRSHGEVLKDIKEGIAKNLIVPNDISIEFSGMVKEQKNSFQYIFYMLILGIILIYMVMASSFESFKDPIIIMFSVPFAFVGVIFFLAITGTNFSIMSLIGVLMLIGIVVNNAIVIVDCINSFKEKMEMKEAIASAAMRRLRPVLITTVTTILGMLPLVFNGQEGSEMWRPFALTIIGGLFSSTSITLIFIPLLYSLFYVRKRKGV